MATQKQRKRFVASMQREFPDDPRVPGICRRLLRAGATLLLYSERACNGEWWDRYPKRERLEELLGKRIRRICAEFPGKVKPIESGDPRGHTLKLKVPSGRADDWGQIGICVPTS